MVLRWLFAVALCGVCLPGSVNAADIHRLDIERDEDDHYRLALDLVLDGPADAVWSLLTDFANWHRLSRIVEESEVLPRPPDGTVRVRTRMQGCVLLFCKTIHHVQTVSHTGSLTLEAVTDASLSDFSFGHARWHLMPESDDTRLLFFFEFRPAFWVPPLIGSWLVERGLRNMAIATAEGFERRLLISLP